MANIIRRTDVSITSSAGLSTRSIFGLMGTLSQGLVRFLYNILLGRFLGPAALGTVNSAMSVALLLSLLWPTSSGQAATRFVAQMRGADKMDHAQAVANYLGRRMLASAILLALATVSICLTVLHADLGTSLSAGLLLLGYAAWSFTRGVQYGAGQIARAAVWDVVSSIASLIMLALVLVFHADAALLIPLALSYGVYGAVCWPRKGSANLDKPFVKQMNTFVMYGVLGTVSSTGLLQLSMIAAKLVSSAHDAGMYAAALSLATPATMMARTLSQVLFPTMAEAGGRGDASSLKTQTDLVTRGLVVTMIPVFGSLALGSPLLLQILYGQKFADAAGLLPVLLIAVMFTTLPVAGVNRLNARGISGARFVSMVAAAGLVLSVILWFILTPYMGLMAIAVGYLVTTICTSILPIARSWYLDGQKWAGLFLRMGAGLAIIVVGLVFTAVSQPPLWGGLVMSVAFVLVWILISLKDISRLRHARAKLPATKNT
ncbi:lipopolysaccharide biosynthesis protein [Arthrobacter sp. lap29]|uniref:lipopolysaccharide biosynthesis protein n=1 Tax=Arthrobacter sp. lap29 TaxID=3056122 RepID=UPI0028F72E1F|nr:lipopolysaccharide biosynthesis protein [Arthrobacter sp. lap29]